jgi:hypothetical protein
MIPAHVEIGSPWKVLPPGIHDASLDEVKTSLATNFVRKRLYKGLFEACQALQKAGCKVIYLDGSFVSEKPSPGDYDACWDPTNVNVALLDPVFLDFSNRRKKQKDKYGGEFFPSSSKADGNHTYLDYFQIDKYTGLNKGIIRIRLQ